MSIKDNRKLENVEERTNTPALQLIANRAPANSFVNNEIEGAEKYSSRLALLFCS
jgi:hypothetical protein